jgi:hypothetical protein
VKWQQLRSDSIRIIYPKGKEETAARVASIIRKMAKADPIAADSRYKPISIILQPVRMFPMVMSDLPLMYPSFI